MADAGRRPLPEWIRQAYEVIETHSRRHRGSLTREEATELLLDTGDFDGKESDAEYAIKYLLNRGGLYEVDDELKITDPDPGFE